ncbi:type VI secretion system protein TssA [Citrobacter farmeri]|uniref:T6SS protein Cts2A n=1 Tax=Citrobacter amalonaticus Y19 TaxID=1261127 RepID=A0A0F6TWV2_CITAM|nr:type VI secretion system protein TssA [Citrobacter amalonaticus]AKE60037.1 T6SS protein Cts2A [Citrobacter amalonaticus Y19]EKV5653098.1 type VI secretion system protein TssA [Citrobacter farmeri]
MEQIDALLIPISPDSPCGESIRYSPEFDQLVSARQEDDESLPTGVWQSAPRRADWEDVARLASHLTTTRSKDLVVMAWLGDAWIRLHGLSALPRALALLTLALEHYPGELHPQIRDGDYDYRAAPLSWVAQHYAALVADTPLFEVNGERITLNQWQQGHHPSPPFSEASRPVAEALATSLQWLQRLNAVCQHWPDASAPSFHVLEQRIKTCQQALGNAPPENTQMAAVNEPPTVSSPVTFASREEAYRMLRQVASYLQRTEPHSPVPYLLERAWAWGHTPLPELLQELISGDESARRLWRQLGVLP